MRWGVIILTVALVFAAAANGGQPAYFCGVREYQWNDTTRDRIIKAAAWYPTHQEPKTVSYGPLQGYARRKAAPAPGRHPLLLISHGTGGSRYNQVYLSESLAKNGYVILAVQHPKNCGGAQGDNSDADHLVNLWDRPKDVSFVLDQALKEVELASHLDPEKIGIIGHSLGGYTALALVGAKPDIGRLDNLCNSLRGWFAGRFCRLKKDELKAWRKGEFFDFSQLQDPRFRAAFVMAPGVPVLFHKNAMADIKVPLLVFLSGKDEVLKGRDDAYRQYLPPAATFVELPEAGHYVYLMECNDLLKQRAPEACSDIGTPRAEVHPILRKKALAFFNNALELKRSIQTSP